MLGATRRGGLERRRSDAKGYRRCRAGSHGIGAAASELTQRLRGTVGLKFSRACVVLTCVAFHTLSTMVAAQTFPTKPVRWVISFWPGGGTDTISRTLTQKLLGIMGPSGNCG